MNPKPISSESTGPERPLTVHVVSHTHWDREWYHDSARFRQRLVALIDALLERDAQDSSPFLLDGQAIVLEDYLTVRPEKTGQIRELLRVGVLEAGPWYVLADGLIPSGEAVVRNLQVGRAVLGDMGAEPPSVAYCPDTFGHAAALPSIALGFGLDVGIVWRGLGGARVATRDLFHWHAPNGDALLTYHLPPDGYEFGSALPIDRAQANERWKRIRTVLEPRATVGVVLLPNGADHHALQTDATAAIDALAEAARPAHVVRSSLAVFGAAISREANGQALPSVRGELRDSYGYTWTLQGTFGTRAAQKRNNALAERSLIRDAEPWLVLAWLHGKTWSRTVARDARNTLAQAPALLHHAWRTVLRSHPHDTLCGCSVDDVALSMDVHLRSARSQARGLRDAALAMSLDHDVVRTRDLRVQGSGHLVVRNRASYARGGVAQIRLVETVGDVVVGPGGAEHLQPVASESLRVPKVPGVCVQYGSSRVTHERRESPQHYPDDDLVRAHYALAWIDPVPALGLRVFELEAGSPATDASTLHLETEESRMAAENSGNRSVPITGDAFPENVSPVTCTDDSGEVSLDNGKFRVVANTDGVTIEANGIRVASALTLESTADLGDAYTPSLRGEAQTLSLSSVALGAKGPLRGSVVLTWQLGTHKSGVRVSTTLILDANADHVRVDVHGANQRRDHRLRMVFHTGVQNGTVYADAAFGPVQRVPLQVPQSEQQREHVLPTMPMHRWVCITSDSRGATVVGDGLAEAEAMRNGSVAITLLRAIGELSRPDLVERPSHAGWPCSIPLAQSIGEFRAKFGIGFHGAWNSQTLQHIELMADAILLPLIGETFRDLDARTVREVAGIELSGDGLTFSAATLAQDGEGIVLRCVNALEHDVAGQWSLPVRASTHDAADSASADFVGEDVVNQFQFALARLDETLLTPWRDFESKIDVTVSSRAISTVRVRRLLH